MTASVFVSGFDFKPFALISGRAYAGWQRVEWSRPDPQRFTGVVASMDLAYTLLGATRFAVRAQRDVSYSAMQGQHAYLLSGGTVSVNHRLSGRWDVGARVGRHRIVVRSVRSDRADPVARSSLRSVR